MKTKINKKEYILSEVTMGIGLKFQREFNADIFEEAGKINIGPGKTYLTLEDMVRMQNIMFASIWYFDKEVNFEEFSKDFQTLKKSRYEEIYLKELGFIFEGVKTTVDSAKK